MIMSGSFTVEKCFSTSNASIQESIVSELSAVRNELSKTRHGPHLMRKLDVEGQVIVYTYIYRHIYIVYRICMKRLK